MVTTARELRACLLEASCHTPELFELGEAAFDEMVLGVEMLVERVLSGAGGGVGNDGNGTLGGKRFAQRCSVGGGIGHDDLGGQTIGQVIGPRAVPALPAGQSKTHGQSQSANEPMEFRAQVAARACEGLIVSFLFGAPSSGW